MNNKKWYEQPEKKSYFNIPKSGPKIKGLLAILIMAMLLFGCIAWFNAHLFKVEPGEVKIAILDPLPPRVIRSPGLHFNPSLDYTVDYREAYNFERELSCRLKDANLIKVNIVGRYIIPTDDNELLKIDSLTRHNPDKLLEMLTYEMQKAIFIGCTNFLTEEVTMRKMVDILDSFEQFMPGTVTNIVVTKSKDI